MDIGFVRLADRWIGSLGCRILSVIAWLGDRIWPRERSTAPRRVLVIGISEMGSVILAYPMLSQARCRYPEAHLYVLMFGKIRESLEVLDLIPPGNVIALDDRNLWSFAVSAFHAVVRMRRLEIDTVLDMELFARISAILGYLSGASRRVGFHRYRMEGLYRGNLLTHRVQYNPYLHISKNQMALLDALGEERSGSPLVKRSYHQMESRLPTLRNTPREDRSMRQKIARRCPTLRPENRLVILNPGGGELPIRAWPLGHYVQLTDLLLEDRELGVGVMGLPSQRHWYEKLAAQVSSDRLFDLTGMTRTVRELVQLFNCGDVLVTSDSGPAHFAALSSIHCIVFFGPETPVLYSPLGDNVTCLYSGLSCSPCLTAYNHRNSPCDGDNVCVKDFSPQHVRGLVLEALRKQPLSSTAGLTVG